MTLPTTPAYEQARKELAARLEAARAAWTAYPLLIDPENRTLVDVGSPEANLPFICWEIDWKGGGQASLGRDPLMVQYGQLAVAAKVKEGAGTAKSLELLEHVVPFIELQDLPTVRTMGAELMPSVTKSGWHYQPLLVTFWVHRISARPAPGLLMESGGYRLLESGGLRLLEEQ